MFKVPEDYRNRNPRSPLGSTSEAGNNGIFYIPHQKIAGYKYQAVGSDGYGWEHVSVCLIDRRGSFVKRCPTWEDMCFIKDLFWDKTDAVIQIHPPEEEYVNNHPWTLHLWKFKGEDIPRPPHFLVGISKKDIDERTGKHN